MSYEVAKGEFVKCSDTYWRAGKNLLGSEERCHLPPKTIGPKETLLFFHGKREH